MPSCCVAGFCSNTREDGFSLHKFPKDPIYREKWTAQVQRTRALWVPHERSVLCSAHFEESCFDSRPALKASLGFEVRYPRVLLDTAVPTIFPRPEHGQSAYCKKEPPPRKRSGSRAIEKREKLRVLAEALGSDYVPAAGSEAEASFPDQDHGKGGDHVKMCAKTSGEYREKVCGPKKEAVPQRQLLEAVFNLQPRIVLCRADITENLRTKWQETEPSHIKEEMEDEEVHHIKEEEEMIFIKNEAEEAQHYIKQEEEDITKFPSTCVPLKSEDKCQSEDSRGAEPPSNSSSQHMTTERDGDHNGDSHPGRLLAPLSDRDDMTSDSPYTDDDDDGRCEGHMAYHTKNKQWKCSQCGKTFASKSSMKQHVKIHTQQRDFSCSVYSQRFTQNGNLKYHITHTGEKPFSCSVCCQRFSDKGNLKKHARTHTSEKPFSCLVCGQRFSQKGNFIIHTRTHTGEKPFSCSVCSQNFAEKGALKRHTRIHTGEKPFSCSICGQKFSQKESLKRHTRTHTGEKPFSCTVCGQNFSEKGTLKGHTRTHTGEKPFSCSICGYRFSDKSSFKRHTRTHTGEKLLPVPFVTKDSLRRDM
ncbi:zinc finger protein 239-like isoform X1 [Syngnathoides biaculeatus]|uniref:zinc finger protein 239-like isoform X1 n=1 Tax=Syngnathoides biaculeatus TaxID=300417 RepID=UPI002ADE5882|nr:zinc finger protein 239-like isoform X1 [Syngnathoides biaculeatus]XP_061663617.1 zinc finger protein 239-like isoform X1 [Syngnathoides biaculeatus]